MQTGTTLSLSHLCVPECIRVAITNFGANNKFRVIALNCAALNSEPSQAQASTSSCALASLNIASLCHVLSRLNELVPFRFLYQKPSMDVASRAENSHSYIINWIALNID